MNQLATIQSNVEQVQENIRLACERANRDPGEITLVAVSKKNPVDVVLAAYQAGIRHFGENRVEEASKKIPLVNASVEDAPIWHMIGHIQSRKVDAVLPIFDQIHSVNRLKIAQKLSDKSPDSKTIPVLIEVNISGEEAKHGFDVFNWKQDKIRRDAFWDALKVLLALPNLKIRGLMTMAPFYPDPEQTRPVFAELVELKAAIENDLNVSMPDLSMGMTNDYEVAIEEGATIVRVGRAIFGARG